MYRLILTAALAALMGGTAMAHDAIPTATQPLGWTYDYSCCSTMDCSEVKDSAVKVTKEGYQIAATGEVIPWTDKRIKRSKDEYYHRCTPGGKVDAPLSLCLYVPDRGL